MAVHRLSRGQQWIGVYPVKKKSRVSNPSQTLLINISGGLGHDLLRLHAVFYDIPYKPVLQNILLVVDNSRLPEQIRILDRDAFHTQPASNRGTKVYYFALSYLTGLSNKSVLSWAISTTSWQEFDSARQRACDAKNRCFLLDFAMIAAFSSMDRT